MTVSTLDIFVGLGQPTLRALETAPVAQSTNAFHGTIGAGLKVEVGQLQEPPDTISARDLVERLLSDTDSASTEAGRLVETVQQAAPAASPLHVAPTSNDQVSDTAARPVSSPRPSAQRLHEIAATLGQVMSRAALLSPALSADALFSPQTLLQQALATAEIRRHALAATTFESGFSRIAHEAARAADVVRLSSTTGGILQSTISQIVEQALIRQEIVNRIASEQRAFERFAASLLAQRQELRQAMQSLTRPLTSVDSIAHFVRTQTELRASMYETGFSRAVHGLREAMHSPATEIDEAFREMDKRRHIEVGLHQSELPNTFDADQIQRLKNRDFIVVVSRVPSRIVHIAASSLHAARSHANVRAALKRIAASYLEPEYEIFVCYGTSEMVAFDMSSFPGWNDAEIEVIEGAD